MREIIVVILLLLLSEKVFAQGFVNSRKLQEMIANEWRDALGGQVYFSYNYPKTEAIYKQLVAYSGMNYWIIFGQTFQLGQAHSGGIIILDYSSIHKDKNILAFIFAHEWGHEALGHQANVYFPVSRHPQFQSSPSQYEDEADIYAGKFLATYNYRLDVVYKYLYSLPETDDHTHSTGKVRAELVKQGYYSIRDLSNKSDEDEVVVDEDEVVVDEDEVVVVSCTHLAHPLGDIIPCSHPAHPLGDIIPCSHICSHPYLGSVPCHPNGDVIPCSHPLHYSGDIIPCTHVLHPSGDIIRR